MTTRQSPAKVAVRDQLLAARKRRPIGEVGEAARDLAAHLLASADVRRAATVTAYVSVNGEPGTSPLLDGLRAAGKRVILPVLLPELADDSAVPARTGAERLYELVTVLFETLSADRPLVLAVEDIHWADSATLELLRFLVRMAERGRILVLLSYRSDEVGRGHPLRSYLAELERTRRLTRWELSRLGRDQVARLMRLAGIDGTISSRLTDAKRRLVG